MSLSLARCVEAVARLLDACGPLEPVRLCLSARDAQIEVCGSGMAARVSLERMAAVAGTEPVAARDDGGGSLTADLDQDVVLVAGIAPPANGTMQGRRATSTASAAELLRTLAAWARDLDQDLLPMAELWVDDQGDKYMVRLLTTAGEAVAAAAGKGLTRLRTRRTDSGLDGVGRLPCGRPVRVGVVCLN
ncbi:hypothetical protein OG883_41070 [Streptomyces sp. NBC_01142]|uniref:hypothetical protein n=1 Tax=Streptomyces sp. NBC_01142 TaxID=2975865 RepID=UPI002259E0A9|nr:hypothetical protein [Streptomyces sp. NBC_01142]MCX4826064.1 hypothetical protein [Streptomyces sp. NBC_01142]